LDSSGPIRISLVIPAHNEERFLPRLLDSVDAARGRYRHGVESLEVIVADNASTDDTAAVARTRGYRVVSVEERRIASVRNGGAEAATGDVLCFIDADSEIHPETFNAIEDSLATGRVVAGATGVRMERWSLGIALRRAAFLCRGCPAFVGPAEGWSKTWTAADAAALVQGAGVDPQV